jgi:hypothetical protein
MKTDYRIVMVDDHYRVDFRFRILFGLVSLGWDDVLGTFETIQSARDFIADRRIENRRKSVETFVEAHLEQP